MAHVKATCSRCGHRHGSESRPAARLVRSAVAAAALADEPALVLLVGRIGTANSSGRVRAGRGCSFATAAAGAGRSQLRLVVPHQN